ncbi:MAG: hypothetical protein KKD69_01450, partial [Euryarchaeota archaeon]|nr:hypothetical protein [Euryarchaeota archaeon]
TPEEKKSKPPGEPGKKIQIFIVPARINNNRHHGPAQGFNHKAQSFFRSLKTGIYITQDVGAKQMYDIEGMEAFAAGLRPRSQFCHPWQLRHFQLPAGRTVYLINQKFPK